jgi:hypothetical protein
VTSLLLRAQSLIPFKEEKKMAITAITASNWCSIEAEDPANQGLAVIIKAEFTLEASLLCVPGAACSWPQ